MAEEPSWKKGVAELVGTFALIYVGVMVLVGGFGAGGDTTSIALAHGLTIAVMASATMSISGGQLNPAVTIGLLATRKITPAQAGINIVMQLVGGILAGYLAKISLAGVTGDISGGVPHMAGTVNMGQAILIEAVLTFFLMFVIMGTGVDPRFGARIGGLAIGFTVALDIMAGGPLTGAAMNPARFFGAAIPAGKFLGESLVYIVGPIVGAVAAAVLYDMVLLEKPRPHPEPAAQMRAKGNP